MLRPVMSAGELERDFRLWWQQEDPDTGQVLAVEAFLKWRNER